MKCVFHQRSKGLHGNSSWLLSRVGVWTVLVLLGLPASRSEETLFLQVPNHSQLFEVTRRITPTADSEMTNLVSSPFEAVTPMVDCGFTHSVSLSTEDVTIEAVMGEQRVKMDDPLDIEFIKYFGWTVKPIKDRGCELVPYGDIVGITGVLQALAEPPTQTESYFPSIQFLLPAKLGNVKKDQVRHDTETFEEVWRRKGSSEKDGLVVTMKDFINGLPSSPNILSIFWHKGAEEVETVDQMFKLANPYFIHLDLFSEGGFHHSLNLSPDLWQHINGWLKSSVNGKLTPTNFRPSDFGWTKVHMGKPWYYVRYETKESRPMARRKSSATRRSSSESGPLYCLAPYEESTRFFEVKLKNLGYMLDELILPPAKSPNSKRKSSIRRLKRKTSSDNEYSGKKLRRQSSMESLR